MSQLGDQFPERDIGITYEWTEVPTHAVVDHPNASETVLLGKGTDSLHVIAPPGTTTSAPKESAEPITTNGWRRLIWHGEEYADGEVPITDVPPDHMIHETVASLLPLVEREDFIEAFVKRAVIKYVRNLRNLHTAHIVQERSDSAKAIERKMIETMLDAAFNFGQSWVMKHLV